MKLEIPETMNAAEILVDGSVRAGRGEKVAIIDAHDGAQYTYADILRMTNRTGNALRDLGVRMEERVMLLLLDQPEFVSAFFGAIKIGAVPIPTNTLLTPADYAYLLNDSRARVAVVSEPLVGQLETVRDELRHLEHIVVAGSSGSHPTYDELVGQAPDELEAEPMSRDDACFWLYSSGTTGFPKGAVHLQHDMLVCADTYFRQVLGLGEGDRTFSVAKLFFAYGLGNALYAPFRVGATTILYRGKPEPQRYWEIIQEHRPTIFYSVPTFYAAMLAHEGAYDTSSLRLCVSAGEALPPSLLERWRARTGTEILDGIGSTEVLHIFISNRPGEVRPGASGTPVPGYEARIVDESGEDVPAGQVGDLLIKGDSTCAYYWNKHHKTRETIIGPWIRTGDKYIRDEEGVFWYQGRSDDMLKVGGMWVSPVEIEAALIEHPSVLECAVVGDRDEEDLIKPRAYVVLRQGVVGSEALAGELVQFCKGRLARYKYPRWIDFVAELPKTATGKIQRYRLRRPEAQPAPT